MAIAASYPALRPSLLLDFANAKAVDPRVTFTRSTTGKFYDGVTTAKAEENLLLRSQDYSATWTVTNLTPVTGKTAPDGTTTATEFTAGAANSTITQSVTAIAADYTFSVYLRRVTGTGDIDIQCGGGTWVTQSITSSWARYDVTQTLTAGTRTPGIRIVTSGDQIEVWGAQLEQRSAETAYTPTTTQPITNYIPVLQTAAAGVPRIDHDPVTGECLGLLIEEQRVNLCLYSAGVGGTGWSLFGTGTGVTPVITTNFAVAPDGTITASRVQVSLGGGTSSVDQSITTQALTGTSCWGSFYIKTNDGSSKTIYVRGSNSFSIVVDGTWRRYDFNAGTLSGTQFGIGLRGGQVVPNDNTADLLVWGAQLEAGAFPTSYIPTVATQETRNADAASMTGTNFSSWYNAGEGSFYSETSTVDTASVAHWQIDDTSANNRMVLGQNTSAYHTFTVITGGATQASLSFGSQTLGQFYKIANAYKTNDIAGSRSGAAVLTDTTATLPVVSRLAIGADSSTGAYLNGHIRKIAYYPQRLTNANLQALTA